MNIAMIGCGCVAGYGHAPAIAASGDLRCVAYVDIDRASAEKFAARFGGGDVYTDYRQVLDRQDIDAVAILTMPSAHCRIALDALDAGKHVFTEKPIASNCADAERMIAKSRATGKKLFVGFLLRYTAVYRKMAEVIHAGLIGKPMLYRMIGFEHYRPADEYCWERAKRFMRDTSPAFDCGSHYVDLMRWYSGAEAVRVQGLAARVNPDVPPGAVDWESYQIEFDDGARGVYETGWGFSFPGEPSRTQKEAIGPKGRVGVRFAQVEEGKESGAETVLWDLTEREQVLCKSEWKGFAGEWAQFGRVVRENLDPFPALHDALAALRIVEAAHRSAMQGGVITFAPRASAGASRAGS